MCFVFTFTITRFLMLILATDLILMENVLYLEIRLVTYFRGSKPERGLHYKTYCNLVFVSGKLSQPSIIFAGKVRAYPSESITFQVILSMVGSWPHPQTSD